MVRPGARIVTPSQAALAPSGVGGGLFLEASWNITEALAGDFGPITVPLFTPVGGFYMWALFVKTNAVTAAGTIVITASQPGSALSASVAATTTTLGLTGSDAIELFQMMFTSDGIVNIDRTFSGYAPGPGSYSAYVNFYRIAG